MMQQQNAFPIFRICMSKRVCSLQSISLNNLQQARINPAVYFGSLLLLVVLLAFFSIPSGANVGMSRDFLLFLFQPFGNVS